MPQHKISRCYFGLTKTKKLSGQYLVEVEATALYMYGSQTYITNSAYSSPIAASQFIPSNHNNPRLLTDA
ncbi:hypothetical protein ABN584_12685 [Gloeocapsa sp. BRSZ]